MSVKKNLEKNFTTLFHSNPQIISRAPGRAEIIGNHTDYNQGFALSAAIDNSTFSIVSKRSDKFIYAYSENFDNQVNEFKLKELNKKKKSHWTNYLKAVVLELFKNNNLNKGFNIYIQSNIPSSGGVSSSAALELAIAVALNSLFNLKLSIADLALLCQKAENGPLV